MHANIFIKSFRFILKTLAWEYAYIWTHEYAMFGLCDVATLAKKQRQKMNPSRKFNCSTKRQIKYRLGQWSYLCPFSLKENIWIWDQNLW